MSTTINVPGKLHYMIAQQFLKSSTLETFVRPYEAKGPLSSAISVQMGYEALPQALHYRVELAVTVTTQGESGVVHQKGRVHYEAIVIVAEDLTEEQLLHTLKVSVGSALFATARNALATNSLGTGYPSTVLPPLMSHQLLNAPGFEPV